MGFPVYYHGKHQNFLWEAFQIDDPLGCSHEMSESYGISLVCFFVPGYFHNYYGDDTLEIYGNMTWEIVGKNDHQ